MQYTLGIDIGTGSVKAVAVDRNGKVLERAQSHYPSLGPVSGISEQDPLVITRHFILCLEQIIQSVHFPPSIISFSSYMHGVMAVDENCSPLTNLIMWADIRSQSVAEGLRSSPVAEKLYSITGAPIHSMLPLCKIIWWQQNEPGICQRAYKFISIKEYIWYQIFHSFQVDYSIANATGLFDMYKKVWSKEALQLCGIIQQQLSDPVPANYLRTDMAPGIAALLNLPAGTSFCIGSSDGCLAVIGSGAMQSDTASLTIGTSGAVRMLTGKPIVRFPEMIFNYILEEGCFVCGGPVNNGGNVVQWLLNQYGNKELNNKESYEELFQSAEIISAGSEGLIFLPYVYGERAPLWDEKASGAFTGIREKHTRNHFLKSALEGICLGLRDVLNIVEQDTLIKQINVSGGFTNSKVWVQLLSDVTGKTLCLMQSDDASALGAAMMAMKAEKWITHYQDIPFSSEPEMFTPDWNNHKQYNKIFPVFRELYSLLKGPMHMLNSME